MQSVIAFFELNHERGTVVVWLKGRQKAGNLRFFRIFNVSFPSLFGLNPVFAAEPSLANDGVGSRSGAVERVRPQTPVPRFGGQGLPTD